ncbi:nucleoporin Nup43 [Anopheles marshallii]|uniref:nucleoporin Nup43 n=1 Tax=Anopheles marshallii TaxID=1521116 RepID=UPI00237C0C9C|nr:nucleoporin Nup43 [Anopheles marshallii]
MDAAGKELDIPNDIQCFLLSNKMSCVRWVPNQTEDEHFFVTGSWGDKVNAINLWNLVHDELTDGESDGVPLVPKSTAKFCVTGDVVGFGFIDDKNLVSVTSEGTLSVLDLNRESAMSYDFTHKFNMHDLHTFDGKQSICSAMSVSAFDQYIVTGGEDGNLNVISGNAGKVISTIKHPDSSSIRCVSFIYPNVVVAGRHCGLLNCYDTRENGSKPVFSIETCHDDDHEMTVPMCINYLPKHKSLILVGLENGSIINSDIRKPYDASFEFGVHTDPVTDIQFAKEQDIMFSADAGGLVTEWALSNQSSFVDYSIERSQPRMKDFKPINSIDVNVRQMICCGDAEMVFIMDLW